MDSDADAPQAGPPRRTPNRRISLTRVSLLVAVATFGAAFWVLLDLAELDRIDAPRPEVVADIERPFDLEPSSLAMPVEVEIQTLVAEIERHVPTTWEGTMDGVEDGDSDEHDVFLQLQRTAFRTSLTDSTARLSATVSYSLRTRYDLPLLPDPNITCGTDTNEPRPRLSITLAAPIDLTRDWKLATATEVESVGPASDEERDRCEVTFLGIDITRRVADDATAYLETQAPVIDSIAHEADVRSRFASWWDTLREPIRLDDATWLELRPSAITRGRIDGRGDMVVIQARLTATPRVVLGARPPRWHQELPPLDDGSTAGQLDILLEAMAEYPAAGRRLNELLRGTSTQAAGRSVRVVSMGVSGIGGGRLAIEVHVDGDIEGRLFLVGTPHYDAESGQVSIPDLAFSVTTSNILVAGASWVLEAELETLLRNRARWPVDEVVEWSADRLREGLNRRLAEGVWLEGSVGAVRIVDVAAMTEGLVVRASAAAEATLRVDRGG